MRALVVALAASVALPAAAPAAGNVEIPLYMHQQSLAASGTYTLAWSGTVRSCVDHRAPASVRRTDRFRWNLGKVGFSDWLAAPKRPFEGRGKSLYEVFDRSGAEAAVDTEITASWDDLSCDGERRGRITVTCRFSGTDTIRSGFYSKGWGKGGYGWLYEPITALGVTDVSDWGNCAGSHDNPAANPDWQDAALPDTTQYGTMPEFAGEGGRALRAGGDRTESHSELGLAISRVFRLSRRQLGGRRPITLTLSGRLPARYADCRAEVAESTRGTISSCTQSFHWSGRLSLRRRCAKTATLSFSRSPYSGGPEGNPGFACSSG